MSPLLCYLLVECREASDWVAGKLVGLTRVRDGTLWPGNTGSITIWASFKLFPCEAGSFHHGHGLGLTALEILFHLGINS